MTVYQKTLTRILCALLCVVSTAGLYLSAAAAEVTPEEADYACLIRSKATAISDAIGQLPEGACLTILAQVGEYYQLDCFGMTGYIAKSQVKYENDKYYVNCKPLSEDTRPLRYLSLPQAISGRAAMMQSAQGKLGCPYVYGAMGPGGFDCSGFVSFVCKETGIAVQRTASAQMGDGLMVSPEALQVGDLLFFRDPGCPWLASHVGIYAGDGQFIHADSGGVRYTAMDNAYYAERFVCARRLLNTAPGAVAAPQNARAALPGGLRTAG